MDVQDASRGGENLCHMYVAFHSSKKHRQMFTFAHTGRRSDLHHMHVALHFSKKHRWMFTVAHKGWRSYLQALQEGGGCIT